MKKKVIGIMAIMALTGALATGCGNKADETEASTSALSVTESVTSAPETDEVETQAPVTEDPETEAPADEIADPETITEAVE